MFSRLRGKGVVVAVVMMTAGLVSAVAPAEGQGVNQGVARQAMSHKNPKMIDIDTPRYVGYDSSQRAYHFVVTGRWRNACGGKYCWPAAYPEKAIGSKDAVKIRFSAAVQVKRMRIRAYDVCDHRTYDRTKSANFGSFVDAYAGVDDSTFNSWHLTTRNGKTLSSTGTCKTPSLPSYTGGAGSSSGNYGYRTWDNLKAHHFTFDVWVNPLPSTGRCYARIGVKGGYTHTWSTSGLSWSVGFPWGVGAGPVSGSSDFTTWQNQDGISDADLVTGKICRH